MDETQEQQQPQLSIVDLQNLRAVVDLSVKRGAFGAAEASSVGAVFDRLNTFLESLAQQQPQQDETAGETPEAQ
jgi:hypothetical protein